MTILRTQYLDSFLVIVYIWSICTASIGDCNLRHSQKLRPTKQLTMPLETVNPNSQAVRVHANYAWSESIKWHVIQGIIPGTRAYRVIAEGLRNHKPYYLLLKKHSEYTFLASIMMLSEYGEVTPIELWIDIGDMGGFASVLEHLYRNAPWSIANTDWPILWRRASRQTSDHSRRYVTIDDFI